MNKNTRPIYMLSTRAPPQIKRYIQAKSKGMEKICKWKGKKTLGQQSLCPTKQDTKTKAIVRDKENTT